MSLKKMWLEAPEETTEPLPSVPYTVWLTDENGIDGALMRFDSDGSPERRKEIWTDYADIVDGYTIAKSVGILEYAGRYDQRYTVLTNGAVIRLTIDTYGTDNPMTYPVGPRPSFPIKRLRALRAYNLEAVTFEAIETGIAHVLLSPSDIGSMLFKQVFNRPSKFENLLYVLDTIWSAIKIFFNILFTKEKDF